MMSHATRAEGKTLMAKQLDLRSSASDRQLIELARTMNLEAMAKRIGRKPDSVLKRAKRLGIKIKMADAR
jgi:hypothetical protein